MVVVRKRRGAVVFAGTLHARSLSVEEIGDRKSEAPNFAIGDKCSVGLLVKKVSGVSRLPLGLFAAAPHTVLGS